MGRTSTGDETKPGGTAGPVANKDAGKPRRQFQSSVGQHRRACASIIIVSYEPNRGERGVQTGVEGSKRKKKTGVESAFRHDTENGALAN